MSRPRLILFLMLIALGAGSARAQDVLTIGEAVGMAGGTISVPVSIRDVSGTPLGADAGTGNRIQGLAFRVTWPAGVIASVTFAREGVAAAATPLFETTLQGSGWMSYVASFSETASPIPFTANGAAPGDTVGELTITLVGQAAPGKAATLRIDPPFAMLSNQAGTIHETVASQSLALANGRVAVTALQTPSALVATAAGTDAVHGTWSAVAGAASYEIWRSSNGDAFTLIGTSSGPSFSDSFVSAGVSYLYRVRALDGAGDISAFSNVDAATTIVFTDEPLIAASTQIKALHVLELRTAVNAMRAAADLPPMGADATVAAGAPVRSQHITALRTALAEARSAAGLPSVTLTDPGLSTGTFIRAAHVQDLRNAVK